MANPFEDDSDYPNPYHRAVEDSMQNTLASTQRSMAMLEESQKIGAATATDLLGQGEKLRNVDQRLDSMNQTTFQTQRYLNNIKSVFGSVKNYWSKDTNQSNMPKTSTSATASSSSNLASVADRMDQVPKSGPGSSGDLPSARIQSLGGADTRWGAMDQEIDENLGQMSDILRNIQSFGTALGDEIDEQNAMIERIQAKTEKTSDVIRNQDNQMKRILKK